MGAAYLVKTDARSDYDVLATILRDRRPAEPPIIAVHLRTGDVVDSVPETVQELLAKATPFFNGGYYVRPASYWEDVPIPEDLPTRVVLFTGFHVPAKSREKSLAYVDAVRAIFERRGFGVRVSIDEDPDVDLAKMAFARHFVPSGGGFSELIRGVRAALARDAPLRVT